MLNDESSCNENIGSATTTELDTEYDIVDEMREALNIMIKAYKEQKPGDITKSVSYLRFLLNELDDALSGEYNTLRRRRFIVKKSD